MNNQKTEIETNIEMFERSCQTAYNRFFKEPNFEADTLFFNDPNVRPQTPMFLVSGSFNRGTNTLFDVILSLLPEDYRSAMNCHKCRRFIDAYGALCFIDPTSYSIVPALWNLDMIESIPEPFRNAVTQIFTDICNGEIIKPFFTTNRVLGNTGPDIDVHTHFNIVLNAHDISYSFEKHKISEYINEFNSIQRFITTTTLETVRLVSHLFRLKAIDILGRERYENTSQRILELYLIHLNTTDVKRQKNVIFYNIFTNSLHGFTESRLKKLYDDIGGGAMSPRNALITFKSDVDPKYFDRDGFTTHQDSDIENIGHAGEILIKHNLYPSLDRRYASIEEIPDDVTLWSRRPAMFNTINITSFHNESALEVSFKELIDIFLPTADDMFIHLHDEYLRIGGLTTSTDPNAEPLFYYDETEDRNPFEAFMYNHRYTASPWLNQSSQQTSPAILTVDKIVFIPFEWGKVRLGQFEPSDTPMIFLSSSIRDKSPKNLRITPQDLRPELKEVISVIDAYSANSNLKPLPNGDDTPALGTVLTQGQRVTLFDRKTNRTQSLIVTNQK